MPFCSQCGNQVNAADRFCAKCGAAQPGAPGAGVSPGQAPWQDSVVGGLPPERVSMLCYLPLFGWIMGLLVLATERFRRERTIRFHAFQGLYLFVTWLLIDLVSDNIVDVGGRRGFRMIFNPLKLAVIVTWIYMMVQTAQRKLIRLPFLGDLADRSVDEQR